VKITDEMFVRLCEAFNRVDLAALPEVRRAVESALADVPEPSPFGDGGMSAHLMEMKDNRIAELKAEILELQTAGLPQKKVTCHWSHLRLAALAELVKQMQSVIDNPEYGE
jgi:hypothetical protein